MVAFSSKCDSNNACPTAGINRDTPSRKLCIQWNIRGLRGALPELEIMLSEENHPPLSLALQETFVGSNISNYTLLQGKYIFHHKPGPTANKGGVCLAVSQSMPHQPINLSTGLQVSAARLDGPQKKTLATIYIPPSHNDEQLEQELTNIIKQLPQPFALMGDFNAKHTAWGNSICDRRGKIILDLVEENNLIILNDDQQTRFNAHRGTTSAIDLTITSCELAPKLQLRVDNDCRGSDHFPIHITFSSNPPEILTRRRWKYELANWTTFENIVSEKLSPNIIHTVEEITDSIITAAENSIPRTHGKPHRKAVPWWNKDVYEAVKKRRKALRKLRKLPDSSEGKPEALRMFQSARANARKIIKEAKKKTVGSTSSPKSTLKLLQPNCGERLIASVVKGDTRDTRLK